MIRYLPGLMMANLVTLALFWLNLDGGWQDLLLKALLPAFFLWLVIALWFTTMSRAEAQRHEAQLLEKHYKEREVLARKIERTRSDEIQKASVEQTRLIERTSSEREQLLKNTHADLLKAERKTGRSNSVFAGLAFASVIGAGLTLLFFQFMSLAVSAILIAFSGAGGYLWHWKQTREIIKIAREATAAAKALPQNVPEGGVEKADSNPPILIDASADRRRSSSDH